MGILSSLITSLTAFYPESLDPNTSKDLVNVSMARILGKFPTFAAWSYKKRNGHPIIYPDNDLDYCSNFLKMMFELPSEPYKPNSVVTDALNKLLKTKNPILTQSKNVKLFEKKWSKWLGRKYSVFCNSGSSANLLMLSALQQGEYLKNNKVVVPSVAWATDLSPVIQLGLEPLLCDSNMKDLSVDLEHLERIFQEESPSVLMFVSVLGLVPDMNKIVELCFEYDVILLEDTCESMGCEYKERKLGTFGKMSSFSTFFGHHISTIEGGIISTDDKDLYELLVSIRSHGWDRDLSKETQNKLQKEWGVSEFNALYTFYYSGFNMRSTDLQAYIGLTQIDRLDDWGKKREDNYHLYRIL